MAKGMGIGERTALISLAEEARRQSIPAVRTRHRRPHPTPPSAPAAAVRTRHRQVRSPYAAAMSTVEANGITIYYEEGGAGERLLFISGTGGDLRQKPSIFDSALPKSFDVLAYDQRGLGQTSVPEGPYEMADYADDAAALLDALEWENCLVVGASFGGMVAQEFTIRHPDKVRRLVLACTSAGGEGGSSVSFDQLNAMSGRAKVEYQIEMMDNRWTAERRASHADEWNMMVQMMERVLEARDAAQGVALTPGQILQLDARSRHNTWDRLPSITCPTLVCGGRYDGIAAPANSERLASQIHGAQLEMYEGGHAFLFQDPAAFPRILEFLSAPMPS
jgi:3-oxoadipate enol-lactonase